MTLRRFFLRRAGALLALACAAHAHAQPVPDMYQEALKSIAEGRKHDASRALSEVIDSEPLHAGAWLDLALIQCSLGHAEEAENIFRTIEERFAPPPGIRELIAATRAKGCKTWQGMSQLSLTAGRGTDDNVNQGASDPFYSIIQLGRPVTLPLLPEFLPKHDQYTSLSSEYVRDLTANGTVGFVQAQARRNDHLHEFDSASFFAGAETPWHMGRWALRTSAVGGAVTLGGKMYQRQLQGQARLRFPPRANLQGSDPFQYEAVASLTRVQYATLDNFDANTVELKGQVSWRGKQHLVIASAGAAGDYALAARPGGDRSGWTATLFGRGVLGAGFSGEAAYVFRSWDSSALYSPGTIDVVRHQKSHLLRAAVTYPLARDHNLVLEARKAWNRENIAIFKYNTALLQLSWQWTMR